MALWDTVMEWWRKDATKYHYAEIAPDHVHGMQYDPAPVHAGRDYFRLWLAEMFLRRDRDWFRSWHPAVHSVIHFSFGGTRMEIPHIAGEPQLHGLGQSKLDQAVLLNYPMTGLMPFNGGVVEMNAGLLAMQGDQPVKRFLGVLGQFSGLLAVPQLSAAMSIAKPIADGIEQLVTASIGGLHLGLHQAFSASGADAGTTFRPGYLAVVLGAKAQLLQGSQELWVDAGRLCRGSALSNIEPLTGYDYMLFRIERRTDRDDWDELASIREPFEKALEALADGESERADAQLKAALVATLQSHDLTRADRRRVAEAVKDRYDEACDLGLGAAPDRPFSLTETLGRIGEPEHALALGELTLEELLSR
jgi:hypothetical protein